jgi:hypothetical protein
MDVARRRVDADLAARMCSEIILTHLGVELVFFLSRLADPAHRLVRLESVGRFALPGRGKIERLRTHWRFSFKRTAFHLRKVGVADWFGKPFFPLFPFSFKFFCIRIALIINDLQLSVFLVLGNRLDIVLTSNIEITDTHPEKTNRLLNPPTLSPTHTCKT